MIPDSDKLDTNEYLEFVVHSEERFAQLQNVFNKLKANKDSDDFADDEDYLLLFDDEAKGYFEWLTPEEDAERRKQWYATPVEKRFTDPSLQTGWYFSSMLLAFKNGEYSLLSCEMVNDKAARLNFFAYSYPYGGTGCMQALIESFGFDILIISDGSCPPYKPEP